MAGARSSQPYCMRLVLLAPWCYGVWVVLTWTRTVEFTVVGVVVAVLSAALLAPLGDVVRPWELLRPRRLAGLGVLLVRSLVDIVRANLSLSRRIWSPSLPLHSGMVVVPTVERSDGGVAAVGLISSLVVDNQIVDIDREHHELLYHAVEVPDGDADAVYAAVNGPVEARLAPVEGER